MNSKNISNTILSFIGLGIFIVLLICALIFLSYIFVIGAAIGLVLFLISYLKTRFGNKEPRRIHIDPHDNKHRVIDQE